MSKFVGRARELSILKRLLNKKIPRLIVLKGRRRIGKSRLLLEFGKIVGRVHILSGLAPEPGISAADQRKEFVRQLGVEFGLTGLKTEDWGDLFWHLAQQTQTGRVLVVLDEVKQKIEALQVKKNFSVRPILIHCHAISEAVEESGFFAKIINFSDYLKTERR